MYRMFASVAIAVMLTVAPVSAATLQVTQGTASVNRGQGFEAVNGSTTVNPGDVVNVPPGSNAQIVYPDGSIQPIQSGNIASVGTSAPASGATTLTQAATPPPGPAPVAGIAGAGGGLTATTVAIGAAAVGVAVGVAVYAAQGKEASP